MQPVYLSQLQTHSALCLTVYKERVYVYEAVLPTCCNCNISIWDGSWLSRCAAGTWRWASKWFRVICVRNWASRLWWESSSCTSTSRSEVFKNYNEWVHQKWENLPSRFSNFDNYTHIGMGVACLCCDICALTCTCCNCSLKTINNLLFCKSYILRNFTSIIIIHSRCFAIHCMSLLCSHRSNCITFLGLGWNRWELIEEKILEFCSCDIIASRSFRAAGELWTVEWSGTWLSLSNWSSTGHRVPSAFPTHTMALSVLFTPSPQMAALHTLFKCSMCRSAGMFLPGRPCT